MIDVAKGEKKLMSVINATVSHEMRNPLNAIYSQNLKQKKLNEEMKILIQEKVMSKKNLKIKLRYLYKE